ncbi:MAG: ribosomal-processing cysteine protease Prp [Clostridia bacterium]|nr:ribosomal-processing cysteine protease Prp [Clostridia bacterium]
MTSIKVFKNGENYTRIICEGHTGYGVEGEDIVCSAISSIVQTGALGMLTVACANVQIIRDEEKPSLEIIVPDGLSAEQAHDVQVIFATMLCGIADLHSEYSDFIELEVSDVY